MFGNSSFVSFRAVLFRMVPKLVIHLLIHQHCFRAVLFRMVPKQANSHLTEMDSFRAVLLLC
ncbi:hypothetical protein AX258_07560 [Streptococcus agalactiae]|nr:hypothetical protein AX258_07560 [Streptococcus agalactiae]